MADIFLSYARGDKQKAVELVQALEAAGKSVWWDSKLIGGEDFSDAIRAEIDHAQKVIVLRSELSVKSLFVKDEAGRARDQGKLVPVKVQHVDLPMGFGSIHTLDWSDGFARILAVVGVASGRVELIQRGRSNIHLSKVERLILINQYEILSHLDKHAGNQHSLMVQKLANGYMDRIFVFDNYIDDELAASIHDDVFAILDMHRFLNFSYRALGQVRNISASDVKFVRFDGNYESEYFDYASFLLREEGLYQELTDAGAQLNSHCPMLDKYSRMLSVWENCANKHKLTEAEIFRILQA